MLFGTCLAFVLIPAVERVITMHNNNLPVFDFFIKGMRILNNESDQHQLLSGNAENEYQAMSCGAFNPRFLAMVKRSKADEKKKQNNEN